MNLSTDVLKTIKMTDFTAIATTGPTGSPHLVAGWNCLAIGADTLLLSGRWYQQTRKNLEHDNRVWLLVACRELDSGYRLSGRGRVSDSVEDVELIRKYWPLCSFAIKIVVEMVEDLTYWKNAAGCNV